MEIKVQTRHILFIILGVMIIIFNFYFFFGKDSRWFKPLIVVGLVVVGSQFLIDFLMENKRQKELELKFLEFVRALVQTVKSGISVPKGILQVANEDYGALSPYVKKLAHQIGWGFPLHEALNTFSKDTNNGVIKKSISIVTEAEKSGGNMGDVLQAVTDSVFSIKKIKEERRSSVYSQMVQGYIIFFVFIGIMLVLQVYLIPKIAVLGGEAAIGLTGTTMGGFIEGGAKPVSIEELDKTFVWLIIIQGLFTGLMIGKFTEGEFKMGVKHSLALMTIGYLIISTVRGI
ncbi:MAG: type II secretion system F family protein [Nanoarchaeota archaeon]